MSVHNAEPNDIYIDEHGKLWRVLWTCREPTVCVEEIEPKILANGMVMPRDQKQGGVSGYMWHGFERIWRKPNAPYAVLSENGRS